LIVNFANFDIVKILADGGLVDQTHVSAIGAPPPVYGWGRS